MNEQQLAALKLALELMHNRGDVGVDEWIAAEAAIKQVIAQHALDKKADNARELGLSYDDEPKIGCVNHDCDQCKAVPHFDHTAAASAALREAQNRSYQIAKAAQPAPVQEPVATLFGSLPVYDTTPPAAQPDYAWPTIEDYEKEVGFEVNIAFRSAWAMARTTNDLFNQMGENT